MPCRRWRRAARAASRAARLPRAFDPSRARWRCSFHVARVGEEFSRETLGVVVGRGQKKRAPDLRLTPSFSSPAWTRTTDLVINSRKKAVGTAIPPLKRGWNGRKWAMWLPVICPWRLKLKGERILG